MNYRDNFIKYKIKSSKIFNKNITNLNTTIGGNNQRDYQCDKSLMLLKIPVINIFKNYLDNNTYSDSGLDWDILSKNPSAIELLNEDVGFHNERWKSLSANPSTINILEKNLDNVDWSILSKNPNAISILERNLDKVDWSNLSRNSQAIDILKENLDKIDWRKLCRNSKAIDILKTLEKDSIYWGKLSLYYLSRNPNVVPILEKNMNLIDWRGLSANPDSDAISILENNIDKIHWTKICGNPNPKIMNILEIILKNDTILINWQNLRKLAPNTANIISILQKNNWKWLIQPFDIHGELIDNRDSILQTKIADINWRALSQNTEDINFLKEYLQDNIIKLNYQLLSGNPNPETIKILENNPDKIVWDWLSGNPNPVAISILEKNIDKIEWKQLSSNYNAIRILENNMDKIHWKSLSCNYNAMPILEKIFKFLKKNNIKLNIL